MENTNTNNVNNKMLKNSHFIAKIKQVAKLTFPEQEKLNKNLEKIADLQAENEVLAASIEGHNISIKKITGYNALELCERSVEGTGKFDKNGFEIKKTTYNLKYPDTVIPVAVAADNANDPVGISVEEEAALQDAVEAQAEVQEAFNTAMNE